MNGDENNGWKPIATFPETGVVDLWAIYPHHPLMNTLGAYQPRRFCDCYQGQHHWQGLPIGWVATHWRYPPKGPHEKAVPTDDEEKIKAIRALLYCGALGHFIERLQGSTDSMLETIKQLLEQDNQNQDLETKTLNGVGARLVKDVIDNRAEAKLSKDQPEEPHEAEQAQPTDDEQKAVVLYAILERDVEDFIDMLREATDATLEVLKQILELENEKHGLQTKTLNVVGASIVNSVIAGRAVSKALQLSTRKE